MNGSLEKIKSTISYIINSQAYPDVMFTDVTYGVVVVDNEVLHYRLSDIHTDNCKVEIARNDNIVYDKRKPKKKCRFCKRRRCNAVLRCCGQRCHFECFRERKHHCECEHYIDTRVPLRQGQPDSCAVCFEEGCTTRTICNHSVCRSCVTEIYQRNRKLSTCPLCRHSLLHLPTVDELKVKVNVGQIRNKQINVKIIYHDK